MQGCARLIDAISLYRPADKVVVIGDRLDVLDRLRQYVIGTQDDGARAVISLTGDVDLASRKKLYDRCDDVMSARPRGRER